MKIIRIKKSANLENLKHYGYAELGDEYELERNWTSCDGDDIAGFTIRIDKQDKTLEYDVWIAYGNIEEKELYNDMIICLLELAQAGFIEEVGI